MVNPTRPEFSFDLYGGLDADLEAAFERNVTLGIAQAPEEIATTGLAAAVESALGSQVSQNQLLGLPENIRSWFEDDTSPALERWKNYAGLLIGDAIPKSLDELIESNPNGGETLEHLYRARASFNEDPSVTPEHNFFSSTMHTVLLPWKVMRANLDNFGSLVNLLRSQQGLATQDFINQNLLNAIHNDDPIYRDPENPTNMLRSSEYLDRKIAADGPWGIMLIQTSNEAGLDQLKGQSPDQMTNNGQDHLKFNGFGVDSLGIFEWFALTLQEDPTKLSSFGYSWMLANRLVVDNKPQVPGGDFNGDQVRSDLGNSGNSYDNARVRLAVM